MLSWGEAGGGGGWPASQPANTGHAAWGRQAWGLVSFMNAAIAAVVGLIWTLAMALGFGVAVDIENLHCVLHRRRAVQLMHA